MASTVGPTARSPSWFGPAPPIELEKNASFLKLISQGAEARVWLVDLAQFVRTNSVASETEGNNPIGDKLSHETTQTAHVGSGLYVAKLVSFCQISSLSLTESKMICKERFSKKYRHPQLDQSLTKSRTKAEARCLLRCLKADVPCPKVKALSHWSNQSDEEGNKSSSSMSEPSAMSSCLFLEYIDGCTVREYFEYRSDAVVRSEILETTGEPESKRYRQCQCETTETDPMETNTVDRITTVIDEQTRLVAHLLGILVAKMHAAGVIHGDLTTSNVMIRNPPWKNMTKEDQEYQSCWMPQLVLIDFGLASSTPSILLNNAHHLVTPYKKQQPKQNKQQCNVEEKAVDLYVLERAFLSTHPESEMLVEEVYKGYSSFHEDLDQKNNFLSNGVELGETTLENGMWSESNNASTINNHGTTIGVYAGIAKAIMNRLEQVRMRGRKRECFG